MRKTRRELGLKAALGKVTIDGREVVTTADGEALAGVPATPDRRFRAGGVAIGYLSTILLQLVDEGRADLDTPVSRWLHGLRYGKRIKLRMLASSTSGL